MKILLHVNYCEGRGRLPELLAMAVSLGYDGVELRWKYAFDDLTQDEYQQRVADFKSRHPAMEIVFGGGIKFSAARPMKCGGTRTAIWTSCLGPVRNAARPS